MSHGLFVLRTEFPFYPSRLLEVDQSSSSIWDLSLSEGDSGSMFAVCNRVVPAYLHER
ncbi:hypothetical protein COLO4_36861 [Corchorus olitorius]|uniref:Uncharacterized protein n=1 Tax=Corchorus olitorius TaxID=93759 RepID=A0A1R3G4R7_9ROSI|nr:hypothetical protein COLO4_36861 [Corchorus olitorius]